MGSDAGKIRALAAELYAVDHLAEQHGEDAQRAGATAKCTCNATLARCDADTRLRWDRLAQYVLQRYGQGIIGKDDHLPLEEDDRG